MPKKKTHKGIAKRFKKSKNGKLTHKKSGYVHKLTKKSPGNKRKARKDKEVTGGQKENLDKLLSS
ncbi:50S ribosomal protein L35 [Candidatus Bipolaricaulota bacterium]|nr:50S ribosomal protein L35 [Candidatus Bipolaricaulota bacterium]